MEGVSYPAANSHGNIQNQLFVRKKSQNYWRVSFFFSTTVCCCGLDNWASKQTNKGSCSSLAQPKTSRHPICSSLPHQTQEEGGERWRNKAGCTRRGRASRRSKGGGRRKACSALVLSERERREKQGRGSPWPLLQPLYKTDPGDASASP